MNYASVGFKTDTMVYSVNMSIDDNQLASIP